MKTLKTNLGNDEKKRAILYLRFSDPKQIGGTSINVQEKLARSACEAEGFRVVDVVKNEAVSADKSNSKRVFDLLDFCKKRQGKFDVLMVYKLDRFARSSEQHHWLRGKLIQLGVVLRSATEKIDESPSGKLIEGVLASVAEYDNEVKRERVKASMWARVEQGLWPWKPPVGYKTVRTIDQRVQPFEIDEKCSTTVKWIFDQFSSGMSSKTDIARELSKKQIFNFKNKRIKFSVQTVDHLLNNHYYMGKVRAEDGRLIDGRHTGLVDPKVFLKCQELQDKLKPHRAFAKKHNPDFPLRRFTECIDCRKPLTAAWSTSQNKTKHGYYHCHNSECVSYSKMIRKTVLETDFCNYLKALKPSEELLSKFNEVFIKRYQEREKEIKYEYIEKIEVIQQLEKERNWIIEQGKKGTLSDAVFKDQMTSVENRMLEAKFALDDIHADELDVQALLDYAYTFIRTIDVIWMDSPSPIKEKLQNLIFPKGVYYSLTEGFSNQEIAPLFQLIHSIDASKVEKVTPWRIELQFTG